MREEIVLASWVEQLEKQNEMALPSSKQGKVTGVRECWHGDQILSARGRA